MKSYGDFLRIIDLGSMRHRYTLLGYWIYIIDKIVNIILLPCRLSNGNYFSLQFFFI